MATLRNGGPAFPGITVNDSDVNLLDPFGTLLPPNGQATYSGMTLRDYFAAEAMKGLLSRKLTEDAHGRAFVEWASEFAYEQADEMLKARGA